MFKIGLQYPSIQNLPKVIHVAMMNTGSKIGPQKKTTDAFRRRIEYKIHGNVHVYSIPNIDDTTSRYRQTYLIT